MSRVWTIGHSTRSAEGLIELLSAHGLSLVLDVRTLPRSRHNPQFNREMLPGQLARAGIGYRHEPGLGGLRKPLPHSVNMGWKNAGFRGFADYMQTLEFAAHMEELAAFARVEKLAVMCAEALPWRCHRSLIADALIARGAEVLHILSLGEARPHLLTPFARVEGNGITYPGLG